MPLLYTVHRKNKLSGPTQQWKRAEVFASCRPREEDTRPGETVNVSILSPIQILGIIPLPFPLLSVIGSLAHHHCRHSLQNLIPARSPFYAHWHRLHFYLYCCIRYTTIFFNSCACLHYSNPLIPTENLWSHEWSFIVNSVPLQDLFRMPHPGFLCWFFLPSPILLPRPIARDLDMSPGALSTMALLLFCLLHLQIPLTLLDTSLSFWFKWLFSSWSLL